MRFLLNNEPSDFKPLMNFSKKPRFSILACARRANCLELALPDMFMSEILKENETDEVLQMPCVDIFMYAVSSLPQASGKLSKLPFCLRIEVLKTRFARQ